MKIEFKPFLNSMNQTFKEMAGVELINGPFESRTGDEELLELSVTINLSGKKDICVLLSASKDVAVQLTSLITGKTDVTAENKLVQDCFGELLNMTVGAAQRNANFEFDFSIPIVLATREKRVSSVFNSQYARVVSKLTGEDVSLYLIMEDIN